MINKDVVRDLTRGRVGADVKVVINGVYVPIAATAFDSAAGVMIIILDEECDDYRTAMAEDEGEQS